MLFGSIDFVIFFITVLSALAIIKYRRFQHFFLLAASYFFFYYSSNYLTILLVYSTVLDFYIGKSIWKAKTIRMKKLLLSVSLGGNLGLLGFYKYADFAIMQFNIFGNYFDLGKEIPLLHLVLPIGISFYVFQTISYTVDIYRGQLEPSKSLREFALFVAFFPQLVAGPILRAKQFLPQLREKIETAGGYRIRQIIFHNQNLKLGITLMALGFFKKMFFADNISPLVDEIFANPIGLDSFSIMLGALAFGIQIYCDFSGYSDIAIGAAMILGFHIPANFNKPYFATSPSDFWRRWHISLSSWLRDYLYIPLGGNRKSHLRTYLNLLITMFLGGLWHGASWNFVIWGMLHGSFLALHRLLSTTFPFLNSSFFKTKVGKIFSVIVTQYLIFFTWIAFRVRDFDHLVYSLQKYLLLDFQTEEFIRISTSLKLPVLLILVFIILHVISYRQRNLPEKISNLRNAYWAMFLCAIMILIFFFYSSPNSFIYFRF